MARVFDHILVPYNGTSGSNKAFRKAVSLASKIQAKITVITCLEERPTFGFFKTKTSKQEFEREQKQVEKLHGQLGEFSEEHDVSFNSKIVKNGMASIKILEFAKQNKVDLIIMTKTKLTNRYEKRHHHSTIENVFRNAQCPVLIL